MSYRVLIPSYSRPDRVRALAAFPEALVVVPASQIGRYARNYPAASLREIDDALDGQVGRKYNACVQIALDEGADDLLMVDDDVHGVGVWEGAEWRELTVEQIDRLVLDGFELARQMAAPLWGLNILKDKRAYSVHRPLKLLAPILGPFTGHCLPHGLTYDEDMGVKQDYDIWLQAIAKYRRTLRLDKYHYLKHEETTGGAYTVRTMDRERQWAAAIMAKWGSRVIKYNEAQKNILDARVNIPIAGC